MKTTTQHTAEQIYRAARADGMDAVDACTATRKACGISFDAVVELSWAVEAKRPVPAWAHGDGRSLTQSEKTEFAAHLRGGEPE